MLNRLEKIRKRYNEINQTLNDPQIFNNTENFLKLTKEQKELEEVVRTYQNYRNVLEQIDGDNQILTEEKDKELLEIAEQELKELHQQQDQSVFWLIQGLHYD